MQEETITKINRRSRAMVLLIFVAVFALIFFILSQTGNDDADVATADADSSTGQDANESTQTTDPSDSADSAIQQDLDLSWREKADLITADGQIDLDEQLALADQALEEGRLYQPESDNAIQYYKNILAQDPENEAAQDGIHTVAVALTRLIQQKIDDHELDDAALIYPRLRLLEDTEEIRNVGDQLERKKRARQFFNAAEQAIASGQLVPPNEPNAVNSLLRARALNPDHPGLESSVISLEQTLINQANATSQALDFTAAYRLLSEAARLRENSGLVLDASNQIERFQQRQIDERVENIIGTIDVYDYSAAEIGIINLVALDPDQSVIDNLTDRIAHHRLYGGFDVGQQFVDKSDSVSDLPTMVVIPAGEFTMGNSSNRRSSAYPAHQVTIPYGLAVSQFEITVSQFRAFIKATGYQTDAERLGYSLRYDYRSGRISRKKRVNWTDGYDGQKPEPDDPVIHVSFNDAQVYADWLSRVTGERYRLPSEAEFEYFLRAGSQTTYWWGNDSPDFLVENLTGDRDRSPRRRSWNQAFSNYDDNYWGVAPVGQYAANPFGLHDVAGNVEEWVEDCWHDSYVRAPGDGTAWVNRGCSERVIRGSYWGGSLDKARSDYRAPLSAESRGATVGIRVVRDVSVLRYRNIAG